MRKNEEVDYSIPNCTTKQLIKLLSALHGTKGDKRLVNAMVGDSDSHHQRNMAMRMGLVEEKNNEYSLTKLGEKVASSISENTFSNIFRENCLTRVPFFKAVMDIVNARKKMSKDELKKSIVPLIGKGKSNETYEAYVKNAINYLGLAKVIKYDKKTKILEYLK